MRTRPATRAATGLAAALALSAALAVPAHAASGYVITQREGKSVSRLTLAPSGLRFDSYSAVRKGAKSRLEVAMLIRYRDKHLFLLDPERKQYDSVALATAVASYEAELKAARAGQPSDRLPVKPGTKRPKGQAPLKLPSARLRPAEAARDDPRGQRPRLPAAGGRRAPAPLVRRRAPAPASGRSRVDGAVEHRRGIEPAQPRDGLADRAPPAADRRAARQEMAHRPAHDEHQAAVDRCEQPEAAGRLQGTQPARHDAEEEAGDEGDGPGVRDPLRHRRRVRPDQLAPRHLGVLLGHEVQGPHGLRQLRQPRAAELRRRPVRRPVLAELLGTARASTASAAGASSATTSSTRTPTTASARGTSSTSTRSSSPTASAPTRRTTGGAGATTIRSWRSSSTSPRSTRPAGAATTSSRPPKACCSRPPRT